MNEALPDILYNGILLCTGIYLALLAFINFFSKKTQTIILGLLCFILGANIINNIFWPEVKISLLLSILVGSGKSIFIGPVIFLYLKAFSGVRNDLRRQTIEHLSIPLLIHVVYITIKFGFGGYYSFHYINIVTALYICESFFLIFYSFKAIKVLKTIKKNNGFSLRTTRTVVLFYILISYFIVGKLYNAGSVFFESPVWSDNFLNVTRYFFMPIGIIVNGLLIVYTVSEMKWIKHTLFKKRYGGTNDVVVHHDRLDSLFEHYFLREKVFTRHELSMGYISRIFELPPRSIRHFLRKRFDMGFRDYVNRLRVEELKKMMVKEESKMYTLTGMAHQVGFKSPATFYRIFKKHTGMTPLEYYQKKNRK